MLSRRTVGAVAFILVLGIAGCFDVGTTTTTTSNTTLDPVKFQSYVARNYSKIPILFEALSRIVTAANGGTAAGVTFSNIAGGVQGTVGVDLDQNGSMESSINAKLIYNNPAVGLSSGATFTVTNINTPYVSGTSTSTVTESGNGSQINFTSGTADLTPNYGPHITVPSASLTVTPSLQSPSLIGHVDFSAGTSTGTLFFESNGAGGWRIRAVGADFTTFTVP